MHFRFAWPCFADQEFPCQSAANVFKDVTLSSFSLRCSRRNWARGVMATDMGCWFVVPVFTKRRAPPDTQTVIWLHLWRFSNVWRWLVARELRRKGKSFEGLGANIQTDMCGRPLLFEQTFFLGSYLRLLQSGVRRSTSDLVDLLLWWKALVRASLQTVLCHTAPSTGLF